MAESTRSSIRFLLGHKSQEVSGIDPQTTVLDWLRESAGRKGTKEGCAEGDCGACTVTVAELHDGKLRYRALNSCIQLMPTLDGKQLITVEDLAGTDPRQAELHPVQQAMVEQHGSQCGFCTPGIVMSLFTLFHSVHASAMPGKPELDETLAGNLCRCTGYASIIKAAQQAMKHAADGDSFTANESATIELLQSLASDRELGLEFQGRRFFAPRKLASLLKILAEFPNACMVAGATDVGLWITKQLRQMETLVYLGEVEELRSLQVNQENGALQIGAAVPYADVLEALAGLYPELEPMLKRLGAEQVRNAGTVGGNIANGSPIGDMPPALIALDAILILSSVEGRRELPLQDFFIEYGKQDLRPGECVESVHIPARPEALHYAVYKLSRRFDQDISSLCAAFSLRLENGVVVEPRICFGGMAGTPKRASKAEQALAGRPWDQFTVKAAQNAMQQDYTPLSDWRGSREYRMQAAQNLLQRFFLETTGHGSVQLKQGAGR